MIAEFIEMDQSLLWSEEHDRAIPEGGNLAEFASVLPQTLRAVSKKLWAIYALIEGVESPDDWEDGNSLDACQVLAADAGRDCELLIGDFARWLSSPKIMAVRLEEALAQAGTSEDAPERAAASDQRNRLYISEITEMLRTAPLAYVLGLRCSLEDSLKGMRAEEAEVDDGAKPRSDDDAAAIEAATKIADINAITLALRRADARFASALRSNLADPNARWSKYLAEANVAEGDEAEPVTVHTDSEKDKVAVGV